MESKNALLGLKLFFVYLFLYAGFVFINTFSAETMEMTPVAGINLAILYGFGLIISALVLALIYGALCKEETPASDLASTTQTPTPSADDSSAASAKEDSQ